MHTYVRSIAWSAMITGSEICLGTPTTLLDTVTMATVWIVCRSTQCERDRAGIRVHLHWKAKEFFGKMQGIRVMYPVQN